MCCVEIYYNNINGGNCSKQCIIHWSWLDDFSTSNSFSAMIWPYIKLHCVNNYNALLATVKRKITPDRKLTIFFCVWWLQVGLQVIWNQILVFHARIQKVFLRGRSEWLCLPEGGGGLRPIYCKFTMWILKKLMFRGGGGSGPLWHPLLDPRMKSNGVLIMVDT